MQLIHELLSRYAKLTPPDAAVRKRLAAVCTEECNHAVQEKNIRIIGPIAYCAFDGALKNALFLKKERILKRLTEEFGKQIIRDIQ